MRVANLEKFKEECAKFDKPTLKALLFEFAFQRTLHELVLVDAINSCNKEGVLTPKTETLSDYSKNLDGERAIISFLGRTEAAKVYGEFEGITSDVKTVDYILTNDSVEYYQKLITSE
jgi:hypothetical protein